MNRPKFYGEIAGSLVERLGTLALLILAERGKTWPFYVMVPFSIFYIVQTIIFFAALKPWVTTRCDEVFYCNKHHKCKSFRGHSSEHHPW